MHDEAERLLRFLEPYKTLELVDKLLAVDPDDTAALSAKVRALWMLRRADEARAELAAAEARAAGPDAALLVARGELALGLLDAPGHVGIVDSSYGRDETAARAAFTAALMLEPDSVPALRGMATVHCLAGEQEWDEAAAERSGDPAGAPGAPGVSGAPGSAGAEPATAEALLTAALDRLGPQPALLVGLGWAAFERWHLAEAIAHADRALEAYPGDIEALFLKRRAWGALGDVGAASRAAEELKEQNPSWSARWDFLEGSLLAGGYPARVKAVDRERVAALIEEKLRAAIDALPTFPAALRAMADHRLENDQSVPPELVEAIPQSRMKFMAAGNAHQQSGDFSAALADFREAARLDPLNFGTRDAIAWTLLRLGRGAEAPTVVAEMLERVPGHAWPLVIAAGIDAGAGRWESAIEHGQRAGRLGVAVTAAGWLELGFWDRGVEVARDAHAAEPDPDLIEILLDVAMRCRSLDEAASYHRELAEYRPADSNPETKQAGRRLRRLRWFRRFRRPPVPFPPAPNLFYEEAMERFLPGAPLRPLGMMQTWLRQLEQVEAWYAKLRGVLWAWYTVAAAVLMIASPFLLLPAVGASRGVAESAALIGGELAVTIGLDTSVTWIDKRLRSRSIVAVLTVALALLAWMLGWFTPALWWRIAALSAAFATAFQIGWFVLRDGVIPLCTLRTRRRSAKDLAQADLLDTLLAVSIVLEDNPRSLAHPGVRRYCLRLLDQVAAAQQRVLLEALDGDEVPRDAALNRDFRRHAAGVAAATRDLRRSVLSPAPDSWDKLRERVAGLLDATVNGWWDKFPYRDPDPVTRFLRARAGTVLRRLLFIAVPPAVLAVLQSTHNLPKDTPGTVYVVAYLILPVVGILLWLDPELPGTLDAARNIQGLFRKTDDKAKG